MNSLHRVVVCSLALALIQCTPPGPRGGGGGSSDSGTPPRRDTGANADAGTPAPDAASDAGQAGADVRTPVVDGGSAADSGVVGVDTGSMQDSGPMPVDGGMVVQDSGPMPVDGGIVVEDSGPMPADAGAGDPDAGPECRRSRDCAVGERCVDGRCVPRNEGCQDDTDCPAGQGCRAGACANLVACSSHATCRTAGEICVIPPRMQSGACRLLRDQACAGDGECSFSAGTSRRVDGLCENGSCRGDQYFVCGGAADCSSSLACPARQQAGRYCLRPCQNNDVCDQVHRCDPQLDHCWYNFCGSEQEVSQGFRAQTNGGRLGGSCVADRPEPPESQPCANNADCANLGGAARCGPGRVCEIHCAGNTNVCGTDATRPWYRCERQDNNNQICVLSEGDGHCVEVEAGNNEWVGLCLAGGYVAVGGECRLISERTDRRNRCGEGSLCAVANEQRPVYGTCHRGCSPQGSHGSIPCARGSTCLPSGGYVCIANGDICDPAANVSCGPDTKCGFFGWEHGQSYCTGYQPGVARAAIGDRCAQGGAQCVEGSVCLSLRAGTPTTCIEVCRHDGSVGCVQGTQCRSLAQLSGGQIQGPYGLCVQ